MLKKKEILQLLDAGDAWQASDNLMKILMEKKKREELFKEFLNFESDLSYDWFSKMYSEELAERTKKKQYFTPPSISNLISEMLNNGNDEKNNYDPCAGTGSLTIANWDKQRKNTNPIIYLPSNYWYVAEELKIENQPSRALPFLLFNFLIRGMNGVVISGDTLTREISQIYFIQNKSGNFLKFSSLNVMPRNKIVETEFDVRKWIDKPIDHIEDEVAINLK